MPRGLRQAPEGAIFEWRDDSVALELGRRTREEGAALIIDYGHAHFGLGDTLQAVAGHSFTDPLRAPGKADLTAHVDFEVGHPMRREHGRADSRTDPPARSVSAARHHPARGGVKSKRAAGQSRRDRYRVGAAHWEGARGMGELFKAIAIAAPKLGALPGFESAS